MSEQGDLGIWQIAGTAIAMALTGAVTWFKAKNSYKVESSEASLNVSANNAVDRALKRLELEIQELRKEAEEAREYAREANRREVRLRKYIHLLIEHMRENGVKDMPEYHPNEND